MRGTEPVIATQMMQGFVMAIPSSRRMSLLDCQLVLPVKQASATGTGELLNPVVGYLSIHLGLSAIAQDASPDAGLHAMNVASQGAQQQARRMFNGAGPPDEGAIGWDRVEKEVGNGHS